MSALTYDGMEHTSADDGQHTRSEVPEACRKYAWHNLDKSEKDGI